MEEESDMYGFQIKLNVQQQAIRLQCDGSSRRNESNWVTVAQEQQLPPEAKLKGMIRLVSNLTVFCNVDIVVADTLT
jgi:hypothetical protein